MFITIEPQSAEPIFEQIVFQVKGAVAKGDLKKGDRLPSVRELAKELAVNPNTVVRAYESLEKEGVVVRRQGSGCFVTEQRTILNDKERGIRLDALMKKTATDAFYLGFTQAEIRNALEKKLNELHFPMKGRGSS